MSDNIAAQPKNTAKTKKLFMSILVRPLSEKSLQRPPFKFIQELVKNIVSETRLLADLYTSQDLDTNCTLEKATKIAFLQKLIIFLDKELDNSMMIDVKAARIVAGLDPDKTNQMLQALACVILSKKTGKSIQSIASSSEPHRNSNSDRRTTSTKQPSHMVGQNASISISGGDTTEQKLKKSNEINSVISNRKQVDSRPNSSRRSSSSSGLNNTTSPIDKGHNRKNSSASRTGISSGEERISSNVRPKENARSTVLMRPTTSSKPPPRVVTKEDPVNSDPIIRSAAPRPNTTSNNSQTVNLQDDKINSENKLAIGDRMSVSDLNDHAADSGESQKASEKLSESLVNGRVNDFEEVVNKSELLNLMKYQDSLKKFDVNRDGNKIWNDQGLPADHNLKTTNSSSNSTDTSNKVDPTYIDQTSSTVTQNNLNKNNEQTNKMKQGLKILAQFIVPADKAVNFIFEDFDSIITDCDKWLEITNRNMKNNSIFEKNNKTVSKITMSKLNDLEVNIEEVTAQVDKLKFLLVQNETKIRRKIQYQANR